ncbi:MAG TPA: hypothetical protein VGG79_01460 [Roseiarcus sp.]|jgi:hypothetical protein
MLTLFFEAYGAFCFFSLVAFVALAAVAKHRPDLDEDEFDIGEFEKLKKLAGSEQPDATLTVEPVTVEVPSSRPPPVRVRKRRKSPIPSRLHLFHRNKPRLT